MVKAVDFAMQLFNNYGNMFSCVGLVRQIACSARQEIELGNQLLFHEAITHNDSLISALTKTDSKIYGRYVVFPINW